MRPNRRAILQTALGLGAAVACRGALALQPTPAQTRGPFYPVTRPLEADADLTRLAGHAERAEGRVVHLMGRVLDAAGRPVAGAKVELWQANARGRYAHPRDVNAAPLDPNFQGFGSQSTDADGQFRFKTVKPAAYPVNPMNPRAVRTPHIHFAFESGAATLVTQLYFPGERHNDSDGIYGGLTDAEQRAVTGSILPATPDLEPDSILLRWDVVLAGG